MKSTAEKKKWKPEENRNYYFVNELFFADCTTYVKADYLDGLRTDTGNCFKTKKEAEAVAKKIRKILREDGCD